MSGPPWNTPHLGCELLRVKVDKHPPKIHVINASVLNESYKQVNDPITIEWDPNTNEIEFLET